MTRAELEVKLEEYRDALRSMETDRWVGRYAEDATVEDPVGSPVIAGTEQLRKFFEGVRKNFSLLDLSPELTIVSPPEVVWKWTTLAVTRDGVRANFEGISSFKFREDGKILQMRAFWDPKEVAARLKASKP